MNNLYSLTARFQQLYHQDEFDYDEMMSLLTLGDELKTSICELGKVALIKKAELRAVQDKILAAEERETRIRKQLESMERVIKMAMAAIDCVKLDIDPEIVLSIRKNPPKLLVNSQEGIPDEFFKIEISKTRSEEHTSELQSQ